MPPQSYIVDDVVAEQHREGIISYRYTEPNCAKRLVMKVCDKLRKFGLPAATRYGTKLRVPPQAWQIMANALGSVLDDITVVHAHSPPSVGLDGLNLARKLGVPFVYEVRGYWDLSCQAAGRDTADGGSLQEYRERDVYLARHADYVITLGDAMAEELQRRGVTHSRVKVVGNGFDADQVTSPSDETCRRFRKDLGISSDFVVGNFGNIRGMEGIELLVDAIRRLCEQGIDAQALIVGDGENLIVLKQLIRRLGLERRVLLPGRVSPELASEYLSLLDVFVVPRLDLPVCRIVSPMKPMQAMAYGKTLAVSNLPALRELVGDGERGLLFHPGDSEALTSCLTQLYYDTRLRECLADSAKEWIRSRSWHYWAQETAKVYDRANRH